MFLFSNLQGRSDMCGKVKYLGVNYNKVLKTIENGVNIIMIESTSVCNGKCDYCPVGKGLVKVDDNEEKFLQPETLKKALELAKK